MILNDQAVTWNWSVLYLQLGCKDVMWQKQTSSAKKNYNSVQTFQLLSPKIHVLERGPCSHSLSFCHILKTDKAYLKEDLSYTLRLSNGSCKFLLKYTTIQVNGISFSCIVGSCCMHASKPKRRMCGSWLTFTTLGSWAPMSNPSIDHERNETMNLTSLFLSAHCKWSLQR